jgi:hypothetical protein
VKILSSGLSPALTLVGLLKKKKTDAPPPPQRSVDAPPAATASAYGGTIGKVGLG